MKTSKAILLTIILFLFLASACSAPAYLGKSYPPTEDVDVYMDAADIKKQYTTMGSSDVDQNFSSVEVMQQKMVDMGKAKGADGVILKLVEEVAAV
ncbi:MAG: hypothetical protein INR69_07790, partial [Mucilaginibacter polytrichastri]|nr:hypothetical protein [Mucilaginibacter polytrichastri]